MATVADIALEQARKLLAELPPTDELTYQRRLRAAREETLVTLNAYVFRHYTDRPTLSRQDRELLRLLEQQPYPEETIQRFLERHIPHWERVARAGIADCWRSWRLRLLERT